MRTRVPLRGVARKLLPSAWRVWRSRASAAPNVTISGNSGDPTKSGNREDAGISENLRSLSLPTRHSSPASPTSTSASSAPLCARAPNREAMEHTHTHTHELRELRRRKRWLPGGGSGIAGLPGANAGCGFGRFVLDSEAMLWQPARASRITRGGPMHPPERLFSTARAAPPPGRMRGGGTRPLRVAEAESRQRPLPALAEPGPRRCHRRRASGGSVAAGASGTPAPVAETRLLQLHGREPVLREHLGDWEAGEERPRESLTLLRDRPRTHPTHRPQIDPRRISERPWIDPRWPPGRPDRSPDGPQTDLRGGAQTEPRWSQRSSPDRPQDPAQIRPRTGPIRLPNLGRRIVGGARDLPPPPPNL